MNRWLLPLLLTSICIKFLLEQKTRGVPLYFKYNVLKDLKVQLKVQYPALTLNVSVFNVSSILSFVNNEESWSADKSLLGDFTMMFLPEVTKLQISWGW